MQVATSPQRPLTNYQQGHPLETWTPAVRASALQILGLLSLLRVTETPKRHVPLMIPSMLPVELIQIHRLTNVLAMEAQIRVL